MGNTSQRHEYSSNIGVQRRLTQCFAASHGDACLGRLQGGGGGGGGGQVGVGVGWWRLTSFVWLTWV